MEIKIPIYNILNMFLTGLVFMGCLAIIYPECALNILKNDIIVNIETGPEIIFTVCTFAAAYEIGLIINRIGSVLIEPFLRRIKIIPFNDDYIKYNNQKKEFPILNTLSREFALSRTGIVLFTILAIAAFDTSKYKIAGIYLIIAFIYLLSCRKHAKKIVDLMNDKDSTEKP